MSRPIHNVILCLLLTVHGLAFAQSQAVPAEAPKSAQPQQANEQQTQPPSDSLGAPATQPPAPDSPPVASLGRSQGPSNTGVVDYRDLECWVYSGKFRLFKLAFEISLLSTYKVEKSCDRISYERLTLASLRAQLRAIELGGSKAARGGTHHNIMSSNLSPVSEAYYEIGNLKFGEQWKVTIPLLDVLQSKIPSVDSILKNPYRAYPVDANFYFIWNTGDLAHRLLNPKGETYIMYSYSNDVSPVLTRQNLVDLKTRLDLPPGWEYQSVLLTKTVTIRNKEGGMELLFDELNNFYVRYNELNTDLQ